MKMDSLKKGDVVTILPEYSDDGDIDLVWIVVEDEEKGRVTIEPTNSTLTIRPRYVCNREWLTLAQ